MGPLKLYGLELGVDTPEIAMSKLNLNSGVNVASCADDPNIGYRFAKLYCWKGSLFHNASRIRLMFVDIGAGPVLQGARFSLPTDTWPLVSAELEEQWGAPDVQLGSQEPMHGEWGWGWASLTAFRFEEEVGKPVIVSAESTWLFGHAALIAAHRLAEKPGEKREQQPIRPFGVHLAYDSKEIVLQKLRHAGFVLGGMGCERSYPRARGRVFETCSLSNPELQSLKFARANFVDLGDGIQRLAQLDYFFDSGAEQTLLSKLTELYGTPSEPEKDWWIGFDHISSTTVPSSSTSVTYSSGRLAEVWSSGMWEDEKAAKLQQQGAL